ncbi:recombinase family protein [Paenarthrobacter nicotinovorans]|uniref:recombinase family protein n=1 Tax=Paenarthrobacter nicotinovorans TaxID=29320 RepID=UPI001ADFB069
MQGSQQRSGTSPVKRTPWRRESMRHPRAGDVIVVHSLDRFDRTVRDTLKPVHELKESDIGIRTRANRQANDTTPPDSQWPSSRS